MSRKVTREQNDISIIIGNLPKRLQKKIAEDVGQSSIAADNTKENGLVHETPECGSPMVQSPARVLKGSICNYNSKLLQDIDNGTQASESGEQTTGTMVTSICQRSAKPDVAVVPGILRLNGIDVDSPKTPDHKMDAQSKERKSSKNRQPCKEVYLKTEQVNISPSHQTQTIVVHPVWFDAVVVQSFSKDLKQLYSRLMLLIQQDAVLMNWNNFCEIRRHLQQIFKQILLKQLKFCVEQKVDTFFWKALFYNIREYIKNQNSPNSKSFILPLINDGLKFYKELSAQLKGRYPIRELQLLEEDAMPETKYSIVAKVLLQKLLICLGDLSRYKAKHESLDDYTEAAKYYRQAQILIPTNGIPYNQLAIVSIQSRKKFDAIYFHMRSLMSSNAIFSAKESLLILFDEIRKKYEENEMKTSPVHQATNTNRTKALRKEVWIYPDGVRRLHRSNVNNRPTVREEQRYREIPVEELLRKFTTLYLYIIGKFYTGIGMESIQESQRKLGAQLGVLLEHDPLVFVRSRLMKIVGLNIFVVEHNNRKEMRREVRYHAFNFCNQMFGFILRKCNQLLEEYIAQQNECDDEGMTNLNSLLQFVKIYTDWLSLNTEIWEPVRSEEHSLVDTWLALDQLFRLLQEALDKRRDGNDFHEDITLDEDNFFVGFTPLATKITQRHYSMAPQSESQQFVPRIREILRFQQSFVTYRMALDGTNKAEFSFESLEENINLCQIEEEANQLISDNELSPTDNLLELLNDGSSKSPEDEQVTELTKLKRELEAKTNVKKMYHAKLEQILKFLDTKLYIEVRPKYLLPDTNCFIDSLEEFQRLVQQFKRYTLIVPLTVVKELDGLSKGYKLDSYQMSMGQQRIHHFDDVSTCAKRSLDFIKTAKNIRCATTKGSIINASLFSLVEEEHLSNDDKILATAVSLSKTMSTETRKDGKCLVQTELVLITTDRNLRVKALSRNLAVSELNEFVQWARDSDV